MIRSFWRLEGTYRRQELYVFAQLIKAEVALSYLANDRTVSPSTHRQALAAILYLYKEVLDIQLP